MIVRTWRGATAAADADRYVDYLHQTGFAEYRATAGNRGVLALRRERPAAGGAGGDAVAEFLLVTLWDSWDAIRRFAGDDPSRAVFYPADDAFLVERDEHVDHFEIVFAAGAFQGAEGAATAG